MNKLYIHCITQSRATWWSVMCKVIAVNCVKVRLNTLLNESQTLLKRTESCLFVKFKNLFISLHSDWHDYQRLYATSFQTVTCGKFQKMDLWSNIQDSIFRFYHFIKHFEFHYKNNEDLSLGHIQLKLNKTKLNKNIGHFILRTNSSKQRELVFILKCYQNT